MQPVETADHCECSIRRSLFCKSVSVRHLRRKQTKKTPQANFFKARFSKCFIETRLLTGSREESSFKMWLYNDCRWTCLVLSSSSKESDMLIDASPVKIWSDSFELSLDFLPHFLTLSWKLKQATGVAVQHFLPPADSSDTSISGTLHGCSDGQAAQQWHISCVPVWVFCSGRERRCELAERNPETFKNQTMKDEVARSVPQSDIKRSESELFLASCV